MEVWHLNVVHGRVQWSCPNLPNNGEAAKTEAAVPPNDLNKVPEPCQEPMEGWERKEGILERLELFPRGRSVGAVATRARTAWTNTCV